MTNPFANAKKKLGLGCMRLPKKDGLPDYALIEKMVDAFLEAGFNYFDTAHGYMNGNSEVALRKCLTSRYPRESYILTNKLSGGHFEKQEDIRPLFESQLEICGVDYFDFYLMHAQNKDLFEKYKRCRAYETVMELKAEGRIRYFGLSFHDRAAVLDQILTEYPQVDVVQIQLNYVDFEDPSIESRNCLEVCRKHGKPVIVMEPVKGGNLVNLPEEAQKVFDALGGGSNASYAIRFAAGQEGVAMVLSGMGDMDMIRDNCGYMQDFQPLNAREQEAVNAVCKIIRSLGAVPCTACRYCTSVCPQGLAIPEFFGCLNTLKIFKNSSSKFYYGQAKRDCGKGAKDCIGCGACEEICPQGLEVRRLLQQVAQEFDVE